MKISGAGILFYKKAMKKSVGIRENSYSLFIQDSHGGIILNSDLEIENYAN